MFWQITAASVVGISALVVLALEYRFDTSQVEQENASRLRGLKLFCASTCVLLGFVGAVNSYLEQQESEVEATEKERGLREKKQRLQKTYRAGAKVDSVEMTWTRIRSKPGYVRAVELMHAAASSRPLDQKSLRALSQYVALGGTELKKVRQVMREFILIDIPVHDELVRQIDEAIASAEKAVEGHLEAKLMYASVKAVEASFHRAELGLRKAINERLDNLWLEFAQ